MQGITSYTTAANRMARQLLSGCCHRKGCGRMLTERELDTFPGQLSGRTWGRTGVMQQITTVKSRQRNLEEYQTAHRRTDHPADGRRMAEVAGAAPGLRWVLMLLVVPATCCICP